MKLVIYMIFLIFTIYFLPLNHCTILTAWKYPFINTIIFHFSIFAVYYFNWPHYGIMPLKHLFTNIIIILHLPYSHSIIITATNQFSTFIGHPLYVLNILSMSLQNWLTNILIANSVKFPNPNVLISATWGQFAFIFIILLLIIGISMSITPADAFHLILMTF